MTKSQKLSIRLSDLRSAINDLVDCDQLDDGQAAKLKELRAEMRTGEEQYRAAVEVEAAEAEARAADPTPSPETRELREIEGRAMLGSYLQAIIEDRVYTGAEGELNAALEIGEARAVPWQALAPRPEARVDAGVTAPAVSETTMMDPTLARVFASSPLGFLGVAMPMVQPGTHKYPVLATGASGAAAAKDAKVDSEAATWTIEDATPHRVSATYRWAREDVAAFANLEADLRRDLSTTMADLVTKQVISGDGTGANVSGLFNATTAPTAAGSSKAAWADLAIRPWSKQVDGVYADGPGAVKVLVGVETYQHAAELYRDTATINQSAWDYGASYGGGIRVSKHVPAPVSTKQDYLAIRGAGRWGVAPVWSALSFLRDELTGAQSGQLKLTGYCLFDFALVRSAQAVRVNLKVE